MKDINLRIFDLNWSWYEESQSYLFYHEDKTEQDFCEDVSNLIKKHIDDILKVNKDRYVGVNDCVEFVAEKLPDLGYQKVIPQLCSFFGANIIRTVDGESHHFGKIIGEDFFSKISEHNGKIDLDTGFTEDDLPF